MQQIKKKLYVEPRVKSVKFDMELGYSASIPDPACTRHFMGQSIEGYGRVDGRPIWETYGEETSNDEPLF